jgi:tRNA A37 threonylcarbamoyladenosine biosynthesis protein TsaE
MEKTQNRISSPEATGGAGPTFEQKVGVYWLVQLLVGCIPPIFVDSVVERVAFQTEHLGWNTDDLLITCANGAGHTKQLAAQVKRTFTVSASDEECEKAILDFWKDFNIPNNFTLHDRFLLITQRGTNTLLDHFSGLLDCARSAQDAEDFEHRLATPGFISNKSVDYADEIMKIVNTTQSVPLARKTLWSFFRSLHVLSLDLTPDMGQAEAAMKSLLAFTAVGQDAIGAADATWNALLKEAGNGAQAARSYKLADLPNALRERHSRIEAKDQRALNALKDHSSMILNGIVSTIGEQFHLERGSLQRLAQEKLNEAQVLLISGPAGSGKSSIAKEIARFLQPDHLVYCFRAEEFAVPHFDNTLQNSQAALNGEGFRALLAAQDRKVVLVESVERLLEKSTRDAFTDFLRIAGGDESLRVVLTCRGYSTELVRTSLLEGAQITNVILNVPDLSDQELDHVSTKFPALRIPLAKPALRNVLRNPYVLGRALQIPWQSETSLPESEREFRSLFWREIVRADHQAFDGMPTRRGRTFIQIALNRVHSLTLFVPREGLDDVAVDALRRDSLISVSESSASQIAPAHDVLEDWAILQSIGDVYENYISNVRGFCESLGAYPAIRRSYRKWISELIDVAPARDENLFLECLAPQIPAWFRDDTILSFLRARGAADFLRSHQSDLFRDERQLLHRAIHLLRVGCVKTPDWLQGQGLLLSIPDGDAWPALLGLIQAHLGEFKAGEVQALLRFLEDWAKIVSPTEPHPPEFEAAAEIAFWLIPHFDNYHSEESLKRTLSVIAKIPAGAPLKFTELFRSQSARRRDGRAAEELRSIVLAGYEGSSTARDLPDLVIDILERELLYREADLNNEDRFSRDLVDLEPIFGLKVRKLEYFPASAARGPVFALLQFHPDKALASLARIFNHSIDWYVRPRIVDRLEPAHEMTLKFPDGAIKKQWCNSRLWNLYRGTSVGPYSLQSFLMALESWLLAYAKRFPASLDETLVHILKENTCGAITAVVASVAVSQPRICADALLALLSCRDCISFDIARMVGDTHPPSRVFGIMNDRPENRIYTSEREAADALEHRRSHLEIAILNGQTPELAARIQRLFDDHKAALPPIEQQSEADRVWRLSLQRMDLRKYSIKESHTTEEESADDIRENSDSQAIVLELDAPEPDVLQMIEKHAVEQRDLQERMRLQNWGLKAFSHELDDTAEAQWLKYLEGAISLAPAQTEQANMLASGAPAIVASVCVRDHWEEMTPEQQVWCATVVTDAVLQTSNLWNRMERVQLHSMAPDRLCAYSLAGVVGKGLTSSFAGIVKPAFVSALTHPVTEVRSHAVQGVADLICSQDPRLAKQCIYALAAEGQELHRLLEAEENRPYDSREPYEDLSRIAAESIRTLFWDLAFPNISLIESDGRSWEVDETNSQILTVWSQMPKEPEAADAFAATARRLATEWTARHNHAQSERNRNYEADTKQGALLEQFVMKAQPQEAERILQPLLDLVSQAPRELYLFFLGVTGVEDREPNTDQFWFIWKLFASRIEKCGWLTHVDDRHAQGADLLLVIFLGTSWKDGVRHWKSLEGHAHLIDDLFERLPFSRESLDDYVRFLYHVGEKSLPDAFMRIASGLKTSTIESPLERADVVFRLEVLLRRYVYAMPFELKRNNKLRDAVLYLLDRLVEEGSAAAFRMRDDFVTPLPIGS